MIILFIFIILFLVYIQNNTYYYNKIYSKIVLSYWILKNRNISFNYANRRTVIASTIPHLRENLGKLLVPIFEKNEINEITKYVKEVLEFQKSRKKLILQVRSIFEDFFNQVFDN